MMNTEHFKQRLRKEEQELLRRIERAQVSGRETLDDGVRDAADESVSDLLKGEQFTEADTYVTQLQQVRDALQRIEDGTFGKCVVDGGPIEEKRLEAIPWTPYCLKHEQLLEATNQAATPSL
jgi:DnaK suppressor protein